jgi:hypothetical protein
LLSEILLIVMKLQDIAILLFVQGQMVPWIRSLVMLVQLPQDQMTMIHLLDV